MPLPRETPPRSRTNDLLDYPEVVADMGTTPGDWCKVAAGVSQADADKITRTLKQHPLPEGSEIETATRSAGGSDNTKLRDVYAVIHVSETTDDEPDDGGDEPKKPAALR